MQAGLNTRRQSDLSDAELLRTIGQDLRSLYSDFLKQPLPAPIEAALVRVDARSRPTFEQQPELAL